MTPPVITFIGRSNSGKTTLLEKLIPVLTSRGYRIGTVKHQHHAHAFQMDVPGKDSWRHKQAGAAVSVLSSPVGLGVVRDVDAEVPLPKIVQDHFSGLDLILVEGFKDSPYPKIEIHRLAAHPEPLSPDDNTVIALVSDASTLPGRPRFDLDDVNGLADFLINRVLSADD